MSFPVELRCKYTCKACGQLALPCTACSRAMIRTRLYFFLSPYHGTWAPKVSSYYPAPMVNPAPMVSRGRTIYLEFVYHTFDNSSTRVFGKQREEGIAQKGRINTVFPLKPAVSAQGHAGSLKRDSRGCVVGSEYTLPLSPYTCLRLWRCSSFRKVVLVAPLFFSAKKIQ